MAFDRSLTPAARPFMPSDSSAPIMPFAPPAHPVPEKAAPSAITPTPLAASAGTAAPSRAGKVLVSGFFDPAVRRALKCLAIERSCSQQELIAHALRLLFAQAISQGSRLVTTLPEQLQAPEEDGTPPRHSRE